MSISDKVKAINNSIVQNKAQYDLDRRTAMISGNLSSGNVGKYEFWTGLNVLPEKYLLEKTAAMKRFEYSLLGKELKKLTSLAEVQYQKFNNAFESNKKKEIKNKKSNLVYNNCFTFLQI